MKFRPQRVLLVALAVLVIVAVYQYRNQILKAPQVRVGPLQRAIGLSKFRGAPVWPCLAAVVAGVGPGSRLAV
jgi:hypothetical protein